MPTRVDLKQLAQDGATTGQAPVWNGTEWAPATVAAGGGGGGASLADDGVVDATKALSSADTRIRGPFTRNYVTNPDAEIDTTGWTAYADAAGVQPVDGTGGSPAVTWTRTTTTPLAGVGSFLLTKDAVNRQGQGGGTPFTIQRDDCGKSLSLSGNVAVNSGTYTPGEVSLWVLDVTSGKLCPISSGNTVQANGSFAIQFTSSTSTSYRLIVHIGGTSALAYTLMFDEFYIGAVYLPGMPAMSDPADYVPTLSAGWGTPSANEAKWWRVGAVLHCRFRIVAGTTTAAEAQIGLPSGLTIDSNVIGAGIASVQGHAARNRSAGPENSCAVLATGGHSYVRLGIYSLSGFSPIAPANVSTVCSTSEVFEGFFSVPITGWAGSTAVQQGSRYLWAQKFAAVATRVTADPSAPGQYRALRAGVDTAPNTAPTVADGFRTDKASGIAAGNIDRYKVFVGKGKVVQLVASSAVGRTGIVCYDLYFNTTFTGMTWGYDPTTGVVEWDAIGNSCGITIDNGVNVLTAYVDILVADDPVPVAMANQNSALSEWQSYTPTITNCGTVTANTAEWRRVGEEIEVRGSFTTGTNAASPATLSLPTGLVVGGLGGTGADIQIVGVFGLGSSTGGNPRCVLVAPGDTAVGFGIIAASINTLTKQNGSALFNTSERESYSFKVKIVGWSATQVVQLGSRYRWAERYAALATRITGGPPSALGQYRALSRGASGGTFSDVSPTTGPSVANGVLLKGGEPWGTADPAGEPSRYQIFVGTGKVVQFAWYQSAGRTGNVSVDLVLNGTASIGTMAAYDPTSGIVEITKWFLPAATAASNCAQAADGNTLLADVYFDIVVADDPVPVAQADQLSALTDWTDGGATAVTAVTTSPTKGTIVRDKVYYRRVGDSAEIRVEFEQSSAGTAGSGDYLFTLPNGLMFDSAEVEFYTGTVAASSRYDRGVGICTQTTVNLETSIVPYDATRFRIRGHAFDNSVDNFISSGVHGFSNTVLRFSVQFAASILGWSGTQAVQLGTRYLWSERFAGSATRVAGVPSSSGQYRAQIRTGGSATFTDNAPSTAPSPTDGFRLFAAATYGTSDTSGQPSRFVVYVGPRKIVNLVAYKSAGRTGFAASLGLAGSIYYYGYVWNYDTVAGTVTIEVPPINGATGGLAVGVDEAYNVLSSMYFDIVVADDPVPVAMEDQVAALTDWQDYVPTITGMGTPTSVYASWRRVGDSIEVRGGFTSGTPTAVQAQFSLPTGLVAAPSVSGNSNVGMGSASFATTSNTIFVLATNGESFVKFSLSTAAGLTPVNGNSFLSSGQYIYFNCKLPILGWTGTQVVQPGTRYQWCKVYGGAPTRVTTVPTGPGQYRFRIAGTDTAPSTLPTAANGFYWYNSGASVMTLDIFIGTGKQWSLGAFLSTGRTGIACLDTYYDNSSGFLYGTLMSYDPTLGVLTLLSRNNVASSGTLTAVTACYVDVTIADDPVPVALTTQDTVLRTASTRNYVSNPDAETDTTGWATYADAAGSLPVDGTGGVASITWTRTTTSPLSGLGSFVLTKDAVNRQGQGASCSVPIDNADRNRSLTLAGSVEISSGTYVPGDVTLHVLDTTTGSLCPISGSNGISATGEFAIQFSSNINTAYRLIVHIASVSALAYSLRFDNFYVGPVYLPSSPAMSDWQDGGAITITGTTNPTKGTTTRDRAWWRRVGDSAEFSFGYVQTSAGSGGSGDMLITLPAGLSFDSTKVAFYTGSSNIAAYFQGIGFIVWTGVYPGTLYAVPYDATRFRVYYTANNGVGTPIGGYHGAALISGYAGVEISLTFVAPITGWSGSTAVQPGSRYLWAQRFAANATRVTAAPSKPGEYRARRLGTDTAPTTVPSAADAFRIDAGSGLAAGRINWYEIYVGPGKVVSASPYASVGRTGYLSTTFYITTVWRGLHVCYDPASGVCSVFAGVTNASDSVGNSADGSTQPATGYFDLLVADDPVPVALAPGVYVKARTGAGQSLTASVTDIIFGTVDASAGGGYNAATGVFTAPVAGAYLIAWTLTATSATPTFFLFKNGVWIDSGSSAAGAQYCTSGSSLVQLAAGDTLSLRCNGSLALYADAKYNILSIARVGN